MAAPQNPINARQIKKAKYVEGLLSGMSAKQALGYCGLSEASGRQAEEMRNDPWVQQQLQKAVDRSVKKGIISREQVEGIVLEAVDIARMKAEAGDMIRGAAELSKMNGFYAPEKKEISIDADVKVRELQELSDAELLEMLGMEQNPIEAEFERLSDDEVAAIAYADEPEAAQG